MVSSFESLGEGGAGCWSCFDRSGYVLVTKRLEHGRFRLPWDAAVDPVRIVESAQLALILEGIDLRDARHRRRWPLPRAT